MASTGSAVRPEDVREWGQQLDEVARPDRGAVRPQRDPRPRPGLPRRPARAGPAEERLAGRRADRRRRPLRRPVPDGPGRLGPRRGPRRPAGLRRRDPRRPRRRPDPRRDRVPQEGHQVGRRRPAVHRHGRADRERPGRRLPRLRLAGTARRSSTGPCTCPRSGPTTRSGARRRASPRGPPSPPSPGWPRRCSSGRSPPGCRRRGSPATRSTAATAACGGGWRSERRPYVLAVRANQYVWAGFRQATVAALAEALPKRAWHKITIAAGSKGPRRYAWAWVPINNDLGPKWRRWLLVRQGLDDPEELAYYIAAGPSADDADPAGQDRRGSLVDRGRLRVGQAGGRAGRLRGAELDGLAPARHPLPARPGGPGGGAEAGRRAAEKKSADEPELIALTVPEARRLLVRLLWSRLPEPDEVLGWSEWRRAHQAFARRCHYKKRGAEPPD